MKFSLSRLKHLYRFICDDFSGAVNLNVRLWDRQNEHYIALPIRKKMTSLNKFNWVCIGFRIIFSFTVT